MVSFPAIISSVEELLKSLWHQWVLSVDAAGIVRFRLFTPDYTNDFGFPILG